MILDITMQPFKVLARSKNIDFRVTSKVKRGLNLYINSDTNKISTVFSNLVSNALKFTPPNGSVQVVISVEFNDMVVEVKDSGIGLTATEQHELFAPLSYISRSREREGGTGLGLVLCKKIIDLHGGTIGVTSAGIDRGSAFKMSLPMCSHDGKAAFGGSHMLSRSVEMFRVHPKSHRSSQVLDEANQYNVVENEPTLKSLRILIVDDSTLIRKMQLRKLVAEGHDCTEANDGDIAVEIVREAMIQGVGIFDLITMDNVMF
jgi:CheY-like chemotaxis protein/anti-sigma regulatory factor (Ser/Thr protein kinase)